MNKQEVKEWLDQIGKDRFWLAEQLSCSKGTVDNWLSRKPFPGWAVKIIENLMRASGTIEFPEADQIEFSLGDIIALDEARQKVGYATLKDFMRDTLRAKAKELMTSQGRKPLVSPRAAEDPTEFQSSPPAPDDHST